MKSKLPWIFLVFALVAGGGAFQWQRMKTAANASSTANMTAGAPATPASAASGAAKPLPVVALTASDLVNLQTIPLVQVLPISGPIKAVNSAFVKARVAGELQDLLVREGDYVKAGQVIARVQEKSGMVIGAGYGKMKETQIRIANFPAVDLEQVETLLNNLV